MIVSHQHRFIFLKTNKTAGTSIEIALSRECGPDDIITPIAPEDEAVRRRLGHRGPQHHLAPLRDYGPRAVGRVLLRGRRKLRFYNHMSAAEVKARIPADAWQGYYKFCFERNPWDRFLSFYYWRHPREPRPSIEQVLDSPATQALKEWGWNVYTIGGQVAVDRVCRYEELAAELDQVRRTLGIAEPLELPVTKAGTRRDRRSYREILTDSERDKIGRLFADEIRLLGYEY